MTEQSLDDIMSGRDAPAPADNATPPEVVDTPAADGHSRDDKGRFAPKQPEAAQAPTTETPQPAAPGHVPIQALDAERGKRKELEERYDRDMRELRDQLARLSVPQTPVTPPAPPPSIFENPEEFLASQFNSQLSPVQQQLQETREMLMELQATQAHGAEVVTAAKKAAETLFNTPEGRALAQKPGNLFSNLVEWHKSQSLLSEIGTDPAAYKQRIIDEYLAQNAQAQPSPTQQPAQTPMPTAFARTPNGGPRGGPEYGGPRPLSEIKPGL